MTEDVRICVLGDELVAGQGDARGLGWVGRVVARTQVDPLPFVSALAVPGETTTAMAARWESETERRFAPGADNRLVLALGSADLSAGISLARSRLNVANILDQTAWTGIVAVAMTMLLITGNFDLSVGSVAAFGGAMTMLVLDQMGAPLTMLLVFAAGLVFGIINGALVQYVGINAFIVTLGTMTTIRGLVQILTDSRTVIAETTSETLTPIQNATWAFSNTLVLVIGAILLLLGVLAFVRRGQGSKAYGAIAALVAGVLCVAIGLLNEHMGHCVRDAAAEGSASTDEMIQEATRAIERLVRS